MDANIYREQIIHLTNTLSTMGSYRRPISPMRKTTRCAEMSSALMSFSDEQKRVKEVAWRGDGCAISQAAPLLSTEEIKGKTLDEVKSFTSEELLELVGVPLSMAREVCLALA